MALRGTDPESYVTEYTLSYENCLGRRPPEAWEMKRRQVTGVPRSKETAPPPWATIGPLA